MAEGHAVGKDRVGGKVCGLPDEHGLAVLGDEAGRRESVGEVGGEIMGTSLPFDRLTAGSVEVTLPRYERVEFCPAYTEVAWTCDEATVPPDDTGQWAVLFDAGAASRWGDTTEL